MGRILILFLAFSSCSHVTEGNGYWKKRRSVNYLNSQTDDSVDSLLKYLDPEKMRLVNKYYNVKNHSQQGIDPVLDEPIQSKNSSIGSEEIVGQIKVIAEVVNDMLLSTSAPTESLPELIEGAVNFQTALIQLELARNLPTLKLELGNSQKPIINLIFSTWRTGSTFLGEVVLSHPGMYYHYEPLLYTGIAQVRSGKLATEATKLLKNILSCNYTNITEYLNYGENNSWLHSHNSRMWKYCELDGRFCKSPEFLSKICQLFPYQVLKTVRMRLKLADAFLKDDSLDVRVVLLVRDPRGIMLSRKYRDWCPQSEDCSNPKLLCSDMVDDYRAFNSLKTKYPGRITVKRYEDISEDPFSETKKIFQFFRLYYNPKTQDFLERHTSKNIGGVSSTFRDSKVNPFLWLSYYKNNSQELSLLQGKCKEAMEFWGYAPLDPFILPYYKTSNRKLSQLNGMVLKKGWKVGSWDL